MKLLAILTLITGVCMDILTEVNQKCPCIERDVCLVKSNYQVFSAFQESAPECPEEKVRCCSETMMLLTLLKIQNLRGLKPRIGRHQKFNNVVDLECRIPSECTQIYGSEQFHFIHISPQRGCPEPFKIRCVVPKERHEHGLQCVLAPLCLEIFGTKQEHFQVHGYQTACRIGHVRCVKVKHGDSVGSGGSGVSIPTATPAPVDETLPGPITQPVTSGPPGPMTPPDLVSIIITQAPDLDTDSDPSFVITSKPPVLGPPPNLESTVITSRPPGQGPVFGTGTNRPPGPPPPLDSVVITSRPPGQGPVFGTGTNRPPGGGGIPDLESTVITSRPRLEVRPFRLEGPGGGKIIVGGSDGFRAPSVEIVGPGGERVSSESHSSVKIVGPSPMFYNLNQQQQTAARVSETDIDKVELEALLRLARERVKALYGG